MCVQKRKIKGVSLFGKNNDTPFLLLASAKAGANFLRKMLDFTTFLGYD